MTKDEALDKALNALLWANIEINDWRHDAHGYKPEDQPQIMEAITAIKQALAAQQEHEPENEPHVSLASVQEPVGEVSGHDWSTGILYRDLEPGTHLYTAPLAAHRQWVGLTDEEYFEIGQRHWVTSTKIELIHAEIEAKLKKETTK